MRILWTWSYFLHCYKLFTLNLNFNKNNFKYIFFSFCQGFLLVHTICFCYSHSLPLLLMQFPLFSMKSTLCLVFVFIIPASIACAAFVLLNVYLCGVVNQLETIFLRKTDNLYPPTAVSKSLVRAGTLCLLPCPKLEFCLACASIAFVHAISTSLTSYMYLPCLIQNSSIFVVFRSKLCPFFYSNH